MILDSADLNETDFACYFDATTQTITNLTTSADNDKNTLTISSANPLKMIDIMWLNFGNSKSDLNLCS